MSPSSVRPSTKIAVVLISFHFMRGPTEPTDQGLGANPTGLGNIDHLIVGAAVFVLIIRLACRPSRVAQSNAFHRGRAGLVQFLMNVVHVIDLKPKMIDSGISRQVARTLACPFLLTLEDCQIDIAI